ncbi:MAG: acyl-CoA thioesterase [Candidatus Omnitrophica bacterium]|nr:acyl-CoA thioesterase [Candidatus Omnitrophota bacterium]
MMESTTEFRVRYAETDQMGVVYYANYLIWFEVARTEFFRERGVEYKKLEDEENIYLPVVESYCRYKSPLKYDDVVTVHTKFASAGASRIMFEYSVSSGDKVNAIGWTKHAFIDAQGKPVKVPSKVRKMFSGIK